MNRIHFYSVCLSLVLLNITECNAQLFVSNNSYVYNKNSLVFVTSDVELNGANSNFYLRNEGQLLQGTSGLSTNKGTGKLSVFQEGTVNNFAYNYWCSPVGNASTSAGNEVFGVSMFNIPTTTTASNAAIISTTTYDGLSSAGSLTIASYWIWKFLSSNTYSQWFQSGSNTDISAGQGFTMKGTSGSDATNIGETAVNNPGSAQRYDFRGKPNDGNVIINVSNGALTLTGNPYPSAIDLSSFLTNELNCTGVAYFWEQDKTVNSHALLSYRGGYGTYSPVSRGGTGIYIPATFYAYDITGAQLGVSSAPMNSYARYFTPIGQGFMIEGNSSGSTVTMKNAYRVYQKENVATSVFERNSNYGDENSEFLPSIASVSGFDYTSVRRGEIPQIKINVLLNEQAIKQTVIAFDNEATDGLDRAKDAKNPNESAVDFNFIVDQKDCVLNVIQFDENKRLPVSLKADQNASFKIKVLDIINFNQAQNVYLFDGETGLYHDIKNGEYNIVLPAGVYNNRFEITFRDALLNSNDNIKTNLVIFQNNNIQTLTVSNPNLISIKSIKLFDINGKEIFGKQKLEAQATYEFSTAGLSQGVYLAEVLTSDNNKMVQKIIVSSK